MKRYISPRDIADSHQTIIFDLDNTLYDENIYIYSAFRDIAKFIDNDEIKQKRYFSFLVKEFIENGRNYLYDKMINNFNLNKIILNDFLRIQRNTFVDNGIFLFSKIYVLLSLLTKFKKDYFIITNGNVDQQKNKIRQINWLYVKQPKYIIYANEYAPKPDPISYLKLKQKFNLVDSIYIGDSITDKKFSEKSKIKFIDITAVLK